MIKDFNVGDKDIFIYQLDPSGKLLSYNENFLSLLSKARQKAIPHKPIWQLFDGRVSSVIKDNNLKALNSNASALLKEYYPGDNGALIECSAHKIPIMVSGELESILNFSTYSILLPEHDLNMADLALENIIANLPGHVYWKNREGVYLGCSDAQAQNLGFKTGSELIGKTDFELPWPSQSAEAFRKNDLHVVETGETLLTEEPAKIGGKDAIVLSQKIPLRGSDGEILGILGMSIDISKQKEFEQHLIREKEKSERAEKVKAEFLANMSHDIRTPLTGIIGMAEGIAEIDLKDEQAKEYAGDLVNASYKLLNLLNEILELTRIEQGNMLGEVMVLDLKQLIQDVIDLLLPAIKEKALTFSLDYDERIPPLLMSRRILLHRILLNLLGNALKFTDQGGVQLKVSLEEKRRGYALVKLDVQDTGIGMAKEKQIEIFEPFARLSSSYQGLYQGTGLGLHIVKQFVDAMEGTIVVDSKENEGSLFTCKIPFRLPDKNEKNQFNTSKKQRTQPASGLKMQAGRVLLVEDDALAQKTALMKLERLYQTVDVAGTAKKALECMKSRSYHLIYLDRGLPDADGCEVAEQFRQWEQESGRSETPIIALTAHVDESSTQKCLVSGMNTVLHKPLTKIMAQNIHDRYVRGFECRSSASSDTKETSPREEAMIIDLSLGAELVGTEESAREILALLAQELPETKRFLEEAYAQENWKRLRELTHKLHGGACYSGTPRLKHAAFTLEKDLNDNEAPNPDHYQALLQEIEAFFAAYRSF